MALLTARLRDPLLPGVARLSADYLDTAFSQVTGSQCRRQPRAYAAHLDMDCHGCHRGHHYRCYRQRTRQDIYDAGRKLSKPLTVTMGNVATTPALSRFLFPAQAPPPFSANHPHTCFA